MMTSVDVRVVSSRLASVEQREIDHLVASELHRAADFYAHTLLVDVKRHLPSSGDGNDGRRVNECYNKNDDYENVDGKDAGNGGGAMGHRCTRAPDRCCSRPWHLP